MIHHSSVGLGCSWNEIVNESKPIPELILNMFNYVILIWKEEQEMGEIKEESRKTFLKSYKGKWHKFIHAHIDFY